MEGSEALSSAASMCLEYVAPKPHSLTVLMY